MKYCAPSLAVAEGAPEPKVDEGTGAPAIEAPAEKTPLTAYTLAHCKAAEPRLKALLAYGFVPPSWSISRTDCKVVDPFGATLKTRLAPAPDVDQACVPTAWINAACEYPDAALR